MVKLSVLLTTLCLQLAYSRRLIDDIDNDVNVLQNGNLQTYEYMSSNYVKITQPPLPIVQKEVGTHVELHCEAMGSPPPTIQWYKGPMRVTENESFEDNDITVHTPGIAKVASRLVINYVLPRHQGNYFCVAAGGSEVVRKMTELVVPNAIGREMNFTQLVFRKIVGAHHLPRVTFWAPAYMDVMRSDVILPCKSVGNPKPVLTWFRPNGKEVTNDDKFQVMQDGELSIRSISWGDMGVYTCIVINEVGKDSVETFLYPMQAGIEITPTAPMSQKTLVTPFQENLGNSFTINVN